MKVRIGSSETAPHDSGRNSTEMDARRTRWRAMRGTVLEVEPTRISGHCGGGSSGYVLTPAQASALGLPAEEWVLCAHEATPVDDDAS